jgi:probable F420-dependent oxidoreductase
MQLGASLPVGDIGTGPAVIRDYAQAAEGLGFSYLLAPDHVLGANPNADHGGRRVGTTATAYHDPFVLFGFLAGCTQKIGFASGVLILAQRQAALVAKQAASLDVLCGGNGRFRLGIGVGWNEVEFTGLNEAFHNRGKRSADQVRVMQALWAEPHVKYQSEFHHLDDAGINPRPASGRVPIWYGGHAEATFRRAARYGDGFMPLAYPPGDQALAAFDKLRGLLRENGRDPSRFGLEVWLSPGIGDTGDWRREIQFWKDAGVTHATVHTTYASNHHKRIAGKTAAEHLDAITRYRMAVEDLL